MRTTNEKPEVPQSGLALIPTVTALELFAEGGVRPVLEKIKAEVRSYVTDPTTERGRKEIASLAHKVAKTKVAMDEMGKSLTDEQRQFIERVNAERRVITAELDALKEEVRRPLTEYEERERARVANHRARIDTISALTTGIEAMDSRQLKPLIERAQGISLDDFDEFSGKAELTRDATLHRLESRYREALASEERAAREAAEAHERAQREREEREARIAAEAADRARRAAEQAARLEAERERARAEQERERERDAAEQKIKAAEREKAEAERLAVAAAARAERERLAAEERHQREIAEAALRAEREASDRERDRRAAEEAARKIDEKRATNKRHQATVRTRAVQSFVGAGIDPATAERIVALIADGEIAGVSIDY